MSAGASPGARAARAAVAGGGMCAVALLAAAVLAGCGDSAPAGGEVAGSVTAPPAAPGGPIVIARPVDGSRLRATETPAGRLRVRTRVHGTTTAGGPVFLSASCRPLRCVARVTAGRDGSWSVSMTLSTTRAARFVTIDASSQARVASTGAAVTTVELAGPRRARTASRSPSTSSASRAPAAPPPPPALPHDVLVVGDSLAIGMADSLRAALPGWRVRVDARIGRPLAEGLRILAGERDMPAIVAYSLFTNDDPSATRALDEAVRATASRPGGCAVWATIVRPPYNGVSYAAANSVLERAASDPGLGLRLVDWAGVVAQSPSFIAGDGVHGTPDGYRARGQLYAGAIRSCAGEG